MRHITDTLFLCYDGNNPRAEPGGFSIKGHIGDEIWSRKIEILRILAEIKNRNIQDKDECAESKAHMSKV